MKPTTDRQKEIRRRAHAKAVLRGLTMKEAVYEALEHWIREGVINEQVLK